MTECKGERKIQQEKMQEESKGHVDGKCFKRVVVDIFE